MDVISITVVGRADTHDGPEFLRRMGSNLQAVKTTPGDADHPHLARTPRLGRKPLDDLDTIGLLEGQVLILEDAVGVTRSPEIDTDSRVSVASEIGVHRLIVYCVVIVLAVRNVLEYRRHWMIRSIFREPNPCSETAAVGHRDPCVIYDADVVGKVTNYARSVLLSQMIWLLCELLQGVSSSKIPSDHLTHWDRYGQTGTRG